MKKIYHLFAFAALAIALTACHPLDKTYKQLDNLPVPKQSITYTLATADFAHLDTSVYAHYTHSFTTTADAKQYIPVILNSIYPDVSSGSNANVAFTMQLKLADSVYKDIAYTLTNDDYLLLPGNKYPDFSISQVINWLPYKYPAPADNQLAVLTYTTYPANATPQPPYSFLYTGGVWQQIYMLTPAQYALVGHGTYNQFASADDANIPAYLNGILKADVGLAATAKIGDVKYVSFNYYSSTKVTSQRVLTLIHNGTNWTLNGNATLGFIKNNSGWVPDPTVYYTLSSADTKLIAGSTFGTDAQRANLKQYGDFSGWATADIQSGIIVVLTADFKTPTPNVDYKVTYSNYTGGADVPTVLTFQYNGTAWVTK